MFALQFKPLFDQNKISLTIYLFRKSRFLSVKLGLQYAFFVFLLHLFARLFINKELSYVYSRVHLKHSSSIVGLIDLPQLYYLEIILH